ncbi:MAG: class I SAM-dependent methyltransferase [Dissulfurimicrobium sp.]|uniref:class I SAM-dependent methyltransferase n=1 Tax=Dissulfurimicrobium sp. TaxID=2022436 RepID=UPI00404A4F91
MDTRDVIRLFSCILGDTPPVPCRVCLWDGTELSLGETPAFTLHIKDPDIMDGFLNRDLSLAFGEAYMSGGIDVEGDIGALVGLVYRKDIPFRMSFGDKARICWLGIKSKARNIKQSRQDIETHYDRGNDFYKLWLDEGLNYSCALFSSPNDTIEEAQQRKIAYTLRKLRLRPEHRLLDIGCGWGSVAIYAAKTYGCRVVGITISEQQYELARKRVNEQGVSDLVDIRLQDYRELPKAEFDTFDRIVSIGMFEHVGKDNIPLFFKRAAGFLRNGGLMLLHTICRMVPKDMDAFIATYIFPGGYIPAVADIIDAAQAHGLDFIDMEDLRPHYDLTLGNWIRRFEAHAAGIKDMMGDRFVRMWRLYLNGSQMAFRHGDMHVFQFLYSLGRRHDLPLTREW